MNRNKIILFIFLLIPICVKAKCSNEEITRYKTLSSNIENYFDYNEQTNKFNITLYNLSNELRVVNKLDESNYETGEKFGETNIGNLAPGQTIKIAIYPKNNNCNDYRVRTIYINLPYYNKYYKESICNNNSSFLCSKWVNTSNYSYEQFDQELKQEKKEEVEEQEPEKEMKRYGFFDFLADYYIPILLVIIISGSVSIYFLDKKSKFDF